MTHKPEVQIGDTYYMFDGNRRVYKERKLGESYHIGGPLYRGHFGPVKVTGETSRSWIMGDGRKISKSKPWSLLHTAEMVDDRVWAHENRGRLIDGIRVCRNVSTLRQIDMLLMEVNNV